MLIGICDDEQVFHDELCNMLQNYYIENHLSLNINHFYCGNQLLNSDLNFDIIFMDFQMDDIDGLETSRILRKSNKDVKIIFITSFPEIVMESFEVDTFRFLVKPVKREKLFKALDEYRKTLDPTKYFIVNTNDGTWKIKHSDIIYLEAKTKHTIIRTANKVYEFNKNLSEAKKMLPSDIFVQCHRAYIANVQYVSSYTSGIIIFDNGEKAQLGKKYRTNFKNSFMDYIITNNKSRRE
ncbi:MAG: LytTR family DNA-binding domain-containing protein [Ruminococcus flavefaciens]|nr:LytTR family DNA-binding domain-containing protein [Ruminococcus flavefaciens]